MIPHIVFQHERCGLLGWWQSDDTLREIQIVWLLRFRVQRSSPFSLKFVITHSLDDFLSSHLATLSDYRQHTLGVAVTSIDQQTHKPMSSPPAIGILRSIKTSGIMVSQFHISTNTPCTRHGFADAETNFTGMISRWQLDQRYSAAS